MASGSLLGLALVVAGAAAIVAAPFTGGASLYLYSAGFVAVTAGGVLNAQAAQPEPISQVARQTGTTNDAESPWEWVYGEVIKGSALTWQGVGGSENEFSGADFVVACHPCDALLGVQIGEWYFPVVTDQAGTDTANGRGIYLNAAQVITDDWPADWYVIVDSSPWVRSPQDDVSSADYHHMGLKWSPGDRTATEAFMATRFGAKYSNRDRKYTGHTVVSIITRVNDEIGTGAWEQVLFHVRGKNDLQDHTGANPAYRNSCAHVFADICREWLGIPVTDIIGGASGATSFSAVATECLSTAWDGASSAPRYDFNGVLRDDMEPTEALQLICDHMMGGYSERGDKVVIYSGSVKTPWADGPLTYDDVVAVGDQLAITIIPPDEDAWANTLVPHFVVMRPNNEDGQNQLYGKMEPAKQDVTSSTYVTEDGGDVLRQDIKFVACTRGRQAKDRAWTALKQMRLGASLEVTCKKRASVLEKGDVVAVQFPDFVPNNTKFQIASKQMILGPDTFSVRLGMVRYEDDIYTPGTTPTEDALGVVPKNRSSIIPAVTGLAAETIDAHLQADGDIVCDVSVTWNLVTNLLVRGAGDIRIAWKKQSASRWRATTVPGDEIETVISGLLQATPYHIRARAEGVATAGRGGRPKGRWTSNLSFTPDSGFVTPGRPGTAILAHNEIHNPNFKQKSPTGAVGWEYETAATGTTVWDNTGGRFGSESTKIEVVSDTRRIRPDAQELMVAEVGQRRRFRFWRRITAASAGADTDVAINVLYYGAAGAGDFISSTQIASLPTTTGTHPYQLVIGHHTVPDDPNIKFLRMQASAKFVAGTYTARFDAFQQKRVLGADSTIFQDVEEINEGNTGDGQTWEVIRSITVGKPGDQVHLEVGFGGSVGDAGTMVGTATLRVRIMRYDADGTSNETTILAAMSVGDTVSGGSGYTGWDRHAVDAVDDSEAAGTYIYRAHFSTNNSGAKARVRQRRISWRLAEPGS